MKKLQFKIIFYFFLPLFLIHCGGDDAAKKSEDSNVLTYHNGIKKIIDSNCTSCHRKGDIAPFSFEEYSGIKKTRVGILEAIEKGTMPPWHADNSCNSYLNDLSLPAVDKEALVSWLKNGLPEGKPSSSSEKLLTSEKKEPEIKFNFKIKLNKPYKPKALEGTDDDHRCFIVPWDSKKEKYVT